MADIELKFEIEQASAVRVSAWLSEFPDALKERLRPAFERLTAELLARVQAAEPIKTGALRAATHSFVDVFKDGIRGRVTVLPEPGQGAHNIKAAALEWGAHGPIDVRAHEMTLDHVFETPIAPEQVMVEAYRRDVNVTELAFLRDSLGDIQAQFEIEIERAIADLQR